MWKSAKAAANRPGTAPAKKTGRKSATTKAVKPTARKSLKARTTEYDDKFVEWELPEARAQDKQYAPTGFYELDMTSDWKTEQKTAFVEKAAEHEKAAGTTVPPRDMVPSSFAWDDGAHLESDARDPAAPRGSPVTRKSHMLGHASEHTRQYNWPPMEECSQAVRPALSSPIALDTDHGTHSTQWQTEYDDRCTQLRQKQIDLVAGVASTTHADIPAFYAWEEPEPLPRAPPAQGPRGASEYKMKFVEWPMPDKVVVQRGADELDLFKGVGSERLSVLRADYPAHEVGVVTLGKRAQDTNPKSFAWSLVDGSAIMEDRTRSQVPKNLTTNNNCSEYTGCYVEPPHKAYVNLEHSLKPSPTEALDLFSNNNYGNGDNGGIMPTEYDAAYAPPPAEADANRLCASAVAKKNNHHYPAHFAWALEGEPEAPREKRAPRPAHGSSEYARNFLPHAVGPAPTRFRDCGVALVAAIDSIIGLDEVDLHAERWESEYDAQCARLRAKQADIHVAGVPSKARDTIPVNYAWEEPAVPPTAPVQPEVENEEVHSEYEESFKQWPISTRKAILPPREQTLNIFATEAASAAESASEETKDASAPGPAPTSGISRPRPHLSEYDDNFHAHVGPRQAGYSAQRGEATPAQFAWPRVDPLPPKSARPIAEHAFAAGSEYDSQFVWPAAAATAAGEKTGDTETKGFLSGPAGTKDWISEYDAQAVAVCADVSADTSTPAGISSVRHAATPHFYAWKEDPSVAAGAAAAAKVLHYSREAVNSEYDSSYVDFAAQKPALFRPQASCETYDLIKSDVLDTQPVSEYAAKYVGGGARSQGNRGAQGNQGGDPLPPQFAWALMDKEAEKVTRGRRSGGPVSEYESCFVWPVEEGGEGADMGAEGGAMGAVGKITKRPDVSPFVQEDVTEWRSEYDNRCHSLQLLKALGDEGAGPAAGVPPSARDNAPRFYAWEAAPPTPAPAPAVHQMGAVNPQLTEYDDKFRSWPTPAARRVHREETFGTFNLGGERTFVGVSEYADKFRPKSAEEETQKKQGKKQVKGGKAKRGLVITSKNARPSTAPKEKENEENSINVNFLDDVSAYSAKGKPQKPQGFIRSKNTVLKGSGSGGVKGVMGSRQFGSSRMSVDSLAPSVTPSVTSQSVKYRTREHKTPTKEAFNPVLMHRRYPYVSKSQNWSTETGANFKWRRGAPKATQSVSLMHSF